MQKIKNIIIGKKIGKGRNRLVYNIGNGYVLKVAKSDKGIKCNKQEVMLYMSLTAFLKKHLGQIIDHEGEYRWLIMKKYRLKFKISKMNLKKLEKLRNIFMKNGINPRDLSNSRGPKCGNLRLNNKGALIVIDYGKFKYYNQVQKANKQ